MPAWVIGPSLEAPLIQLPSKSPLFLRPKFLGEKQRGSYFWKRRVIAGLPEGTVLHSYHYAWADRALAAHMPEREPMVRLGHGSKAAHCAYARSADRVTMPLEWYED